MSGVLAHYDTLHGTVDAISRLREAGHTDLQVWSPIPAPEIEEAMDIHSSPVGMWTLIGGITGLTTGVLLTIGTSLGYPLVTQGKPIVSLPPFVVFMFELTVLLTGIFGLVALLVHARRPVIHLDKNYRTNFSVDRWGVFVPADAARRGEAEALVRETGAVEVEVTE
jgi:Alternative complex III, ActD subunit